MYSHFSLIGISCPKSTILCSKVYQIFILVAEWFHALFKQPLRSLSMASLPNACPKPEAWVDMIRDVETAGPFKSFKKSWHQYATAAQLKDCPAAVLENAAPRCNEPLLWSRTSVIKNLPTRVSAGPEKRKLRPDTDCDYSRQSDNFNVWNGLMGVSRSILENARTTSLTDVSCHLDASQTITFPSHLASTTQSSSQHSWPGRDFPPQRK